MQLQSKRVIGKVSLAIAISAGALLLHIKPAEANNTPLQGAINLPTNFQWIAKKNVLTGDTTANEQAAINGLSFAKSYDPSYNSTWYYDVEIFLGKNLPAPVGTNIGLTGNTGSGGGKPVIQTASADTTSVPLDPLASLSYAEKNSPSYNSTWGQDINLFLNRPFHPTLESPTAVPEPGSLLLLGTSMLGLALIRTRRSQIKKRA